MQNFSVRHIMLFLFVVAAIFVNCERADASPLISATQKEGHIHQQEEMPHAELELSQQHFASGPGNHLPKKISHFFFTGAIMADRSELLSLKLQRKRFLWRGSDQLQLIYPSHYFW